MTIPEQIPLGAYAETIREMLVTLGTLTSAGQRHSMGKVVEFVARRVRGVPPRIGRRNRARMGELVQWLRREVQRPLPDVAVFCRHTESLVALLASLEHARFSSTHEDVRDTDVEGDRGLRRQDL